MTDEANQPASAGDEGDPPRDPVATPVEVPTPAAAPASSSASEPTAPALPKPLAMAEPRPPKPLGSDFNPLADPGPRILSAVLTHCVGFIPEQLEGLRQEIEEAADDHQGDNSPEAWADAGELLAGYIGRELPTLDGWQRELALFFAGPERAAQLLAKEEAMLRDRVPKNEIQGREYFFAYQRLLRELQTLQKVVARAAAGRVTVPVSVNPELAAWYATAVDMLGGRIDELEASDDRVKLSDDEAWAAFARGASGPGSFVVQPGKESFLKGLGGLRAASAKKARALEESRVRRAAEKVSS